MNRPGEAAVAVRAFEGNTRVAALSPGNRGLAYGDGLFETMRVHRGTMPWWDAHWARLAQGAGRLGLVLPGRERVLEEATALLGEGGRERDDGVLKLLVLRGGTARGYSAAAAVGAAATTPPAWQLSRHPLPAPSPPAGLRLHWCEARLALQPLLAGLKHCNRLEQVLARAECDSAGCDEGLVRDTEGNVVSATAANLFVLHGEAWSTPPVDRCGVAGVCRAHLLDALDARERRLQVADVEAADAIVLCNAVRGILPVASLGPRDWTPHPAVAGARAGLAQLHAGFAPAPDGE